MKKLVFTGAALMAATQASAGTMVYSSMSHAPEMSDAMPMAGNTAGWLIPLVAIALIILASNIAPSSTSNGGGGAA